MSFKTKEELDNISEEDVKLYRWKILEDAVGFRVEGSKDKQYVEELAFYQASRFKESQIVMYKKWESDGMNIFSKNDYLGQYKFSLAGHLKDVGDEFHYIKGIELSDDITFEQLNDFNNVWYKK